MITKLLKITLFLLVLSPLEAGVYKYQKNVNVEKLANEITDGLNIKLIRYNKGEIIDGSIVCRSSYTIIKTKVDLNPSQKSSLDTILSNHTASPIVIESSDTVKPPKVETPDFKTEGKKVINQEYHYINSPNYYILVGSASIKAGSNYTEILKMPAVKMPFTGTSETFVNVVGSCTVNLSTVSFRVEYSTDNFKSFMKDKDVTISMPNARYFYGFSFVSYQKFDDVFIINPISIRVVCKITSGLFCSTENKDRTMKVTLYPATEIKTP